MDIKIPEGLEERLLSSIDRWEQEELAHKTRVRRLWYAAAACLLLAFVGGTWFLQDKGSEETQTPPTAEVIVEAKRHPSDQPNNLLAKETPQAVTPAKTTHAKLHGPKRRAIIHKQVIEATHNDAADTRDENVYFALLTEVEAQAFQNKQLEQQSIRALFDELIDNIEQQPNQPELCL